MRLFSGAAAVHYTIFTSTKTLNSFNFKSISFIFRCTRHLWREKVDNDAQLHTHTHTQRLRKKKANPVPCQIHSLAISGIIFVFQDAHRCTVAFFFRIHGAGETGAKEIGENETQNGTSAMCNQINDVKLLDKTKCAKSKTTTIGGGGKATTTSSSSIKSSHSLFSLDQYAKTTSEKYLKKQSEYQGEKRRENFLLRHGDDFSVRKSGGGKKKDMREKTRKRIGTQWNVHRMRIVSGL